MKYLYLTLLLSFLSFSSFAVLPITGPSSICDGTSATLSDGTSGGTWASSDITVATVGAASGVVTGVSAGTTTITYTAGGPYVTTVLTVLPAPPPIGGPSGLCPGASITLSDAAGGGVWSTNVTSVAVIGSATGVLMGMTTGSTTVTYKLSTGCAATSIVSVFTAPPAMTGISTTCLGGTISLSDAVTGGVWTSSNTSVVSVGPGPTFVTGVAGTATISYSIGAGCATSSGAFVLALPTVYTVTGGGSYCAGGTGVSIGLSGSATGINYALYESGTIYGSVAGTGSSISFGSYLASGTYTVVATSSGPTACTSNMTGSAVVTTVSVVTPLVSISSSPGDTVCAGTSDTYTAVPVYGGATPGYQWLINGTPVAGATSTTFSFIPITGDIVSVDMTSSAPCILLTTAITSLSMVVNALPTITASSTPSSCGEVYTLTGGGGVSYSWSPTTGLSCPSCATTTINPAATTTYTVTGTDANGCVNNNTVTINGNRIYGHVTFSSSTPDTLDTKVWLIQFNPIDSSITALDSVNTCTVDSIGYFEFDGEASGNYLVKAALLYGNPAGVSGYVPTYSLSSPYWYAAATAAHTSGSDSLHITMVYGTVPSGPGFIGGYVYAGAGKGTSGDAPATGMLIYLENSSTHILTHAYTDATGAYSFANLAYGNYAIYPEAYSYNTTPSSTVTLNSSVPSINGIDFKQYTTSKKILPFSTTIVKTPAANMDVTVYPNPASNVLNIQWNNQSMGNGNIIVTDITGREVLNGVLNVNAASGETQINLAGLNDGVYLVNIKAGSINYNGRVIVQQ